MVVRVAKIISCHGGARSVSCHSLHKRKGKGRRLSQGKEVFGKRQRQRETIHQNPTALADDPVVFPRGVYRRLGYKTSRQLSLITIDISMSYININRNSID